MIYFMVVTVTTVGYGDIAPVTMEGRMSVIVIIMVIIGLFPNQYSELSRINSLTSKYERDSLKKRSNQKHLKHILILGDATKEAFLTFLTECYHSDHGSVERMTVIMRNSPPSEDLINIINMPQFEGKITYLQGSPLNTSDLIRCQADQAHCCIILANQFS